MNVELLQSLCCLVPIAGGTALFLRSISARLPYRDETFGSQGGIVGTDGNPIDGKEMKEFAKFSGMSVEDIRAVNRNVQAIRERNLGMQGVGPRVAEVAEMRRRKSNNG